MKKVSSTSRIISKSKNYWCGKPNNIVTKFNKPSKDRNQQSEGEREVKTIEEEEEDDHKVPWLDGDDYEFFARFLAESALKYLNEDEGKFYELVQPGPNGGAVISGGPILHVNFEAKAKDDVGCQVETFFSQMRMHGPLVVDSCVSLGPTVELPHWRKSLIRTCVDATLGGCRYCNIAVHHPTEKCHKLIRGIKDDDITWLYGD